MKIPSETNTLFDALRKSAKPEPVRAIEKLIQVGSDRDLCRINALAFAANHNLNEEDVIAAFLHGARLGIFDMSWSFSARSATRYFRYVMEYPLSCLRRRSRFRRDS